MSPNHIAESPQKIESGTRAYASPWAGYTDKPDEMPLGGYATLLVAYGEIFATGHAASSHPRGVSFSAKLRVTPCCTTEFVRRSGALRGIRTRSKFTGATGAVKNVREVQGVQAVDCRLDTHKQAEDLSLT